LGELKFNCKLEGALSDEIGTGADEDFFTSSK
jgi:hypothetical protein